MTYAFVPIVDIQWSLRIKSRNGALTYEGVQIFQEE
jgi:hypothetical protein